MTHSPAVAPAAPKKHRTRRLHLRARQCAHPVTIGLADGTIVCTECEAVLKVVG